MSEAGTHDWLEGLLREAAPERDEAWRQGMRERWPELAGCSGPEVRAAGIAVRYARAEGIVSIPEALRWYRERHGVFGVAPQVKECVTRWLAAKQAEGLARASLKHYGLVLRKFGEAVGEKRPVEVSEGDIVAFLRRWPLPTTMSSRWLLLSLFFRWCVGRRYLAENPVPLALPRPRWRRSVSPVLTPEEAGALLARVKDTNQIGFWVLALFGGLRSVEIERLQATGRPWSYVRDGVIDLVGEVTKAAPRSVPIRGVLRRWLAWVRRRGVDFFPVGFQAQSRKVRRLIAGGRLGAQAVRNIARRSCLSYQLAERGAGYAAVAEAAGNSERVLRDYYRGKVSAAEARRYFALTPAKVARVRLGGKTPRR